MTAPKTIWAFVHAGERRWGSKDVCWGDRYVLKSVADKLRWDWLMGFLTGAALAGTVVVWVL